MTLGWFKILLLVLATVVLTLIGVWAWMEFKSWRINRKYGPSNRRGRRRND